MSGIEEVNIYKAVHLRYEDSNIRYGDGCEIEVVSLSQHNRIVEQYKRDAERYKAIFEGNRLVVDRLIYDEKYGGQEEW